MSTSESQPEQTSSRQKPLKPGLITHYGEIDHPQQSQTIDQSRRQPPAQKLSPDQIVADRDEWARNRSNPSNVETLQILYPREDLD